MKKRKEELDRKQTNFVAEIQLPFDHSFLISVQWGRRNLGKTIVINSIYAHKYAPVGHRFDYYWLPHNIFISLKFIIVYTVRKQGNAQCNDGAKMAGNLT